jgi:hypothetical protein
MRKPKSTFILILDPHLFGVETTLFTPIITRNVGGGEIEILVWQLRSFLSALKSPSCSSTHRPVSSENSFNLHCIVSHFMKATYIAAALGWAEMVRRFDDTPLDVPDTTRNEEFDQLRCEDARNITYLTDVSGLGFVLS